MQFSSARLARGALLFLAVAFGQGAAVAQPDNSGIMLKSTFHDYGMAARDLIAKMGESGSDGLPEMNDPVFRRFSNEAAALTGTLGPRHALGMATVQSVCGPASRVVTGYALAGLTGQAPEFKSHPLPEQARRLQDLIRRNRTKYLDQIYPVALFSIHCALVHAPIVEPFISGLSAAELTDVRKQGVLRFRTGIFQVLAGALMMASDPGLDDARKAAVLELVARDAGLAIPTLPLAERAQIAEMLKSVPATGKLRVHVERIAAGLRSEHCGRVCSL